MASIWANLRSRKWELQLSKHNYHYFSLHLDGTPFNNNSGVLYGEQINDIPRKCTQVLSKPSSNFLSSEEVMESINGAELCNMDEDAFLLSQNTQQEIEAISNYFYITS